MGNSWKELRKALRKTLFVQRPVADYSIGAGFYLVQRRARAPLRKKDLVRIVHLRRRAVCHADLRTQGCTPLLVSYKVPLSRKMFTTRR